MRSVGSGCGAGSGFRGLRGTVLDVDGLINDVVLCLSVTSIRPWIGLGTWLTGLGMLPGRDEVDALRE